MEGCATVKKECSLGKRRLKYFDPENESLAQVNLKTGNERKENFVENPILNGARWVERHTEYQFDA